MRTSYFSKYKDNNGISICTRPPVWFIGKEYRKLAPKYWMLMAYKKGKITEEEYIEIYKTEVLSKLDPMKVYDDLINLCGEDSVLLCWEASGKFCHRHIVSEWLNDELGTQIVELQIE